MGPKITDEFKRDAVGLALTSGLTRGQVASDLGIAKSTLNRWIREHRDSEADTDGGVTNDLEAELVRLRHENRILKEEREILKKATQFFARTK